MMPTPAESKASAADFALGHPFKDAQQLSLWQRA